MTLAFGIHLVRSGRLTADQLIDALEFKLASRPQLGQLALQMGTLSLSQLFEILAAQRIEDKAFGEIAVERNFLTRSQVAHLLLMQYEQEPKLCDVLRDAGFVSEEEYAASLTEWRLENRKRETLAICALQRELVAKATPGSTPLTAATAVGSASTATMKAVV